MRDATQQTQFLEDALVLGYQCLRYRRFTIQQLAGEYASLMRCFHRWAAVLARDGEQYFTFVHDRVHVEDIAWDESLHQIERPLVAERIIEGAKLDGIANHFDSDSAGQHAWLKHP